jgi:hypothetical protein
MPQKLPAQESPLYPSPHERPQLCPKAIPKSCELKLPRTPPPLQKLTPFSDSLDSSTNDLAQENKIHLYGTTGWLLNHASSGTYETHSVTSQDPHFSHPKGWGPGE